MYRPHFPTYARNTSRKRIAKEVPTGQVQLKRGSADTEHGMYRHYNACYNVPAEHLLTKVDGYYPTIVASGL